jgi:hypothetical protein
MPQRATILHYSYTSNLQRGPLQEIVILIDPLSRLQGHKIKIKLGLLWNGGK